MRNTYPLLFIILLLGYIIIAFTLPTDPQVLERYDITQKGARFLNLTIVLPLSAIYLVALYGFQRFNDYAISVRKTKEGPHLEKIANGLMVLAFSLPVLSIVGSLFNYLKYRNPEFLPMATILRNYLTLVFAFTAILLIAKGSQGLFDTLKSKKVIARSHYALAGIIALTSIYTWLITSQGPAAKTGQGYFLPDWLVIATLAIPYIFIWCEGVKASIHLSEYKGSVKGIIYKRAFDNLSKGIAAIIVVSVFIQFITTLSEKLSRLNLTPLLLVIYVLIVLYAIGYGLVARGAKRLKQIEEV